MQSPKKVAKYLSTKDTKSSLTINDTQPPGAKTPPPKVPNSPREGNGISHVARNSFEDDSLRIHSLTPIKVLEKIRGDVIVVLGIQGSIAGKFTHLEQKLVDFIERIIRKGHCPSILIKERDLIEAMLCLKKYFESNSVAISPNDNPGSIINVPVFPALYKYAKDAAFCEQRIRELRQQRSRNTSMAKKKEFDVEILQLKERKDNCLIYYQKIIFSDAENLQTSGTHRRISLYGKGVSLDELLTFLKKGGRLEQARSSPQKAQKNLGREQAADVSISFSDNDPENTLGSFDRTDTLDEVVDWRKIKSGSDNEKEQPDDESSHYSFNL